MSVVESLQWWRDPGGREGGGAYLVFPANSITWPLQSNPGQAIEGDTLRLYKSGHFQLFLEISQIYRTVSRTGFCKVSSSVAAFKKKIIEYFFRDVDPAQCPLVGEAGVLGVFGVLLQPLWRLLRLRWGGGGRGLAHWAGGERLRKWEEKLKYRRRKKDGGGERKTWGCFDKFRELRHCDIVLKI